ncbi:MAG TPA: hypothetical protein VF985_09025 [Mariniflexile sp.]
MIQTQNPKPKTQNPEPKTQNPEPKTQNPNTTTNNQQPKMNYSYWEIKSWFTDIDFPRWTIAYRYC